MDPSGRKLELPLSKLSIRDGCLLKESTSETVTGQHRLTDILEVSLSTRISPGAIITGCCLGGLAFLAFRFIGGFWSWVLTIVLGLFALIALLIAKQTRLTVNTIHGQVSYDVSDETEDSTAFLLTLRSQAAEAKIDKLAE